MNGNAAARLETGELLAMLQAELAETNREILALTLDMDTRVDERTTELKAAQDELQRTNSELLQLALELENRVDDRTAELARANKALQYQIEQRRQAELKLISINEHLEGLVAQATAELKAANEELEARVADRTAALEQKNEELRVMTQQLWQAAKLATMGELAASVAHELNNPLATVSLRLEAITAQTDPGDPKRRLLDVVTGELDRMAALVANLLAFSRRSPQHISTLDVSEEVEKTIELVRFNLDKCGVSVERDYDPDVPHIHADRQQLRQLFLNLFQNAADAMPGGGTLVVGIAPSADRRRVVINVKDNGSGIAPENLARLSEPFFTTKPEGKGTGLGLSICRRIVTAHHGELTIESEPAKGTTVRIVFPVRNGSNGAQLSAKEA